MYLLVFFALACFILLSSLVKAPIPEPHNVEGFVFHIGEITKATGVPVHVNNTITGDTVLTYTVVAPQFVPQAGSYAVTIEGNDGDMINITSWNRTYYGFNVTNLTPETREANITLKFIRDSEANVTIIEPLNNTLKNKSMPFNVTANITILGNDGIDCNATISFSDNSIINISSGENFTHVLGNIPFENYKATNWSVAGINEGSSNITVRANCDSDGVNLEHLNSHTISNITMQNLAPTISNIAIDAPVDLVAGDNITVLCNASIGDGNKVSDIRIVNATFFQESVGFNAPDDNNDHYTNSSCVNVSSSIFQSNHTCGFKVAYYANNGTWQCNITTMDFSNATGFSTALTSINELLAIDVSPAIIDYGNLEASNISAEVNTTIRNFGNVDFNTSVRAFAPNESLAYLNLSMTCPAGNISNANQRFSTLNGTAFDGMTRLNNETQLIQNLTLPQRTNDIAFGSDTNSTFWRLQVPSGESGLCNGTMVFGAMPLS